MESRLRSFDKTSSRLDACCKVIERVQYNIVLKGCHLLFPLAEISLRDER